MATQNEYLEELNEIRANLIEVKRDFYAYKIQQEKLNTAFTQVDSSPDLNSPLPAYLIFLFGVCLGGVLFLIWYLLSWKTHQIVHKIKNGFEDKLKSQLDILEKLEMRVKDLSLKKCQVQGDSGHLQQELLLSYEKMLELDPENSELYYKKAEIEACLERKVSAIQDLKSAIFLDSKWKEVAKRSQEFKNLTNFAEFRKVVAN